MFKKKERMVPEAEWRFQTVLDVVKDFDELDLGLLETEKGAKR